MRQLSTSEVESVLVSRRSSHASPAGSQLAPSSYPVTRPFDKPALKKSDKHHDYTEDYRGDYFCIHNRCMRQDLAQLLGRRALREQSGNFNSEERLMSRAGCRVLLIGVESMISAVLLPKCNQ